MLGIHIEKNPACWASEVSVERRLISQVTKAGGKAFKWVSPGNAGVPDRIVLYPVPPEHQALVSRYVQFIEVKAPGKKARPLQLKMIEMLQRLGYEARVIDAV